MQIKNKNKEKGGNKETRIREKRKMTRRMSKGRIKFKQ
jgi:hypothetical protein